MDSEDMPDFLGGPPPAADDVGDLGEDADEDLEGMLEDALEDAFEENEAEMEGLREAAAAVSAPEEQTSPAGPSGVAAGENLTLESLPRGPDGLILVESLTAEQHKVYTAALMSVLTEGQQQRYETFRQASLKDPMIKLVQAMTGAKPEGRNRLLIAMGSVAKTFVGELIEEARKAAEELGDKGALQPAHVHQAYQRLKAAGILESEEPRRAKLRL